MSDSSSEGRRWTEAVAVSLLHLPGVDAHPRPAWYCEHLDFERFLRYPRADLGAEVQVLGRREIPLRLSLRCIAEGSREPFNEREVGMDHVALGVADGAALAHWQERLEQAGISCSRTDQPELSILVFRDPDNIQIELCTPLHPRPTGAS